MDVAIVGNLLTQAPAGKDARRGYQSGLCQDRAGEHVAVEFRLFVQKFKGLQADSGVETVHVCGFHDWGQPLKRGAVPNPAPGTRDSPNC